MPMKAMAMADRLTTPAAAGEAAVLLPTAVRFLRRGAVYIANFIKKYTIYL